MKSIGITGPTGAGKTTALHALSTLGVHAIDCDGVYHRLLTESEALRTTLTGRFGGGILIDGAIDRKALGSAVFATPADLEALNAITHRFVAEEVERQVTQAANRGAQAVAIDAIALIESGLADRCDAVVGVLAPAELRIRRIMAREGISEAYARKRVGAQKEDAFFRANCTHILENTELDSAEDFCRRAQTLFRLLLKYQHK